MTTGALNVALDGGIAVERVDGDPIVPSIKPFLQLGLAEPGNGSATGLSVEVVA